MEQAVEQRDIGAQDQLLTTLEQMLQVEAIEVKPALDQISQLVSTTLGAEKVDVFLLDRTINSLVAVGTSNTELGRKQHAIGMSQLPLVNGGRAVGAFTSGVLHTSGHVEQDAEELIGIKEGLGVRSCVYVPFNVHNERRGVLGVDSTEPERFNERDVQFLQAVAHWIGLVVHRAELVERITQEAAENARRVAAEELITILAHDLGNYLTPLVARSYLLQSRAEREGRATDAANIRGIVEGVTRLQHLVTDLLDVGRLEQGLFTLNTQPLDLVHLIQHTVLAMRVGETDIEVKAPSELIVEADPNRLHQALSNLLSNAIKHAPAGTTIDVSLETRREHDASWAVLSVHDRGPGIASELLPHLFTRFVAGTRSNGLGLGLFLARGIAEAHGGTLTADSVVGTGATFSLQLPLPAERSELAPRSAS